MDRETLMQEVVEAVSKDKRKWLSQWNESVQG